MFIKVGGHMVDANRISDVRHDYMSLFVYITMDDGEKLRVQFSNSEDADALVAYIVNAKNGVSSAVVPASKKSKHATEIDLIDREIESLQAKKCELKKREEEQECADTVCKLIGGIFNAFLGH